MLDRDHAVQVRLENRVTVAHVLTSVHRPYGFNVPYRKLFRQFEDIVARNGGRPHWAKAHHLRPADLRAMYPRFDDFSAVLHRIDPSGVMRNEYVARHILGENIGERIFKPRP